MPLVAGTRLDSYEIVAPLGAGGMGEVYRARDTALKRDVAIKVLPDFWSHDPDRLHRFEFEARAAAALNHPNIVSIFHVSQYDDSPYIVSELLHGETLRERLCKGALRLHEALDHGAEIARGLGAAHDAGIIHRDLKPENIFITRGERVKILDFGLAKLDPSKSSSRDDPTLTLEQQTSPGQVLGTAGYMSPEQVRGHPADPRSDIFALGAVLYEMLSGKRAFQKATSAETMSAILNEDPAPISLVAPHLPPGLQRVVNRCLAKNPEQRFQHASDLAFALEALSDSGSAVLVPGGQKARYGKWLWITSAFVISVAAGLLLWWKLTPATPVVEAVTQLTDDGIPKYPFAKLATDGSRIYFNEGETGSHKIAQVAVSGGPTAILATKLSDPVLAALSPEGTSFLAMEGDLFPSQLWTIPVPAGEPHPVAGIDAMDATYFPDGRILFVRGADFYITEKEGLDPQKLTTIKKSLASIEQLSVSPDGSQIAFTAYEAPSLAASSIMEIGTDGAGLHTIATAACCPNWIRDGKYLVYAVWHQGTWDLWTLPATGGPFRRSQKPARLTNGPLSYAQAISSRDGKQLFAVGTKRRGELVRYDAQSKQFLPILSGISAFGPTFSADGKWVAYISYPDATLWRSRADGTERKQLTYPPMSVTYPFISPDGKRVAFGTVLGDAYVINIDGSSQVQIGNRFSMAPNWSPDGNWLILTHRDTTSVRQLQLFNLPKNELATVPSSTGLRGGQWIAQDEFVAFSTTRRALVVFNVTSQKWSDLVSGNIVNWAHSPDWKYLYYTTGGPEPKAMRLRLADHAAEFITSLKDIRRAVNPGGNTQISVAPDGSPVFTRDMGTQEVYALTIRWP